MVFKQKIKQAQNFLQKEKNYRHRVGVWNIYQPNVSEEKQKFGVSWGGSSNVMTVERTKDFEKSISEAIKLAKKLNKDL